MKYDKEHIDPLIESLTNGDGRVRAVAKGRISYECFTEWMASKVEFSEAVKKAEAVGNDKLKDICKRRILEDKSWQSAAWWLERRYPNEYKNRAEVQQYNNNPVPVTIEISSDVRELRDTEYESNDEAATAIPSELHGEEEVGS
jgi:hypothetical protein